MKSWRLDNRVSTDQAARLRVATQVCRRPVGSVACEVVSEDRQEHVALGVF